MIRPLLKSSDTRLLILPLWMINNHADTVVEALTRLLFA